MTVALGVGAIGVLGTGAMPRVVVIVDPRDFFESRNYIVKPLAEAWRGWGIAVAVHTGAALAPGIRGFLPA